MKDNEKKQTLKERLKDKRERAKIELILYGIFFLIVVVFVRVLSVNTSSVLNSDNLIDSFIFSVEDNYEYDMLVTINDNIYEYYGKVLGNNSTINFTHEKFYLMNGKYYILKDDNYILTTEEEVYPYIEYRYLNINNIKRYIELSTRDNDVYKVKLSDIVLDSESEEYLIMNINEGDKNIVIDYTSLFKLMDENVEKVIVNITYNNIDNIISLDE